MITISELYGKRIMSTTGRWLGEVQHVVLDLESGSVSHLLLQKIDAAKNDEMLKSIFKSGIKYERVKKISETILASDK
ncbi:MAG: PRC-barrel domain-containing protein [Candidatus Micrarchaeaceae archaeon]